MPSETLVILAKYWAPGEVKTRLAKAVGPEQAAEISRLFLECSTARFAFAGRNLVVAYGPGLSTTAEKFREANLGPWELLPQTSGHLGQRMKAILREQFEAGSEAVVLLGADSPHLPLYLVEEAFLTLRNHKVVLGPSEDGGYYLVGATRKVPPIFDDIPWSTAAVWRTTLERLEAAKLDFHVLRPWYDVDRLDDLSRMMIDLQDTDDQELVKLRRRVQDLLSR